MGRWLSQDPAFLAVGTLDLADIMKVQEGENEERENQALRKYLSNPQNLNSYSYVNNNPLKYNDPNGEFALNAGLPFGGALVGALWKGGAEYISDVRQTGSFKVQSDVSTEIMEGAVGGALLGITGGMGAVAKGGVFVGGNFIVDYSYEFGDTQDFGEAWDNSVGEMKENLFYLPLQAVGMPDAMTDGLDTSIDYLQGDYQDE